jgi:hypothetical protein
MDELGEEGEIPIDSWDLLIIYLLNALFVLLVPYCRNECSTEMIICYNVRCNVLFDHKAALSCFQYQRQYIY